MSDEMIETVRAALLAGQSVTMDQRAEGLKALDSLEADAALGEAVRECEEEGTGFVCTPWKNEMHWLIAQDGKDYVGPTLPAALAAYRKGAGE
jgi:hypothetical protein